MVIHFTISMHFRRNLKIDSENIFYGISAVGVEFITFHQKVYFSGLGPPKHVPDAYVYKGDYAGCRKDAFGREKCTFQASKRSKTWKSLLFVNLACKSTPVAAARKKYQYIIGCASVSGKCWMTVFHEIYDFQCKSMEFLGNTWKFQIFL